MDTLVRSKSPSEDDRRDFLKSCGRFAATVPPAITVMLATSLTSNAIAKSTGARDSGSGHPNGSNAHFDIGVSGHSESGSVHLGGVKLGDTGSGDSKSGFGATAIKRDNIFQKRDG
jgi:hypothetical protein